jgi:diacylglycerol O-acyltransferase / wax synthase
MHHQRLSSVDASFLHIENDREPQHVGSLAEVEGAPLRDDTGRIRIEELRSLTAGRLHRVPRMRQKVMFVPYGLGPPVWVDDEHFDISYHVRLTALPRPGDDAQLRELFGRVQSLRLDRARPLWELWVVDGLEDDRVGLIVKCHHAMGDGMANVDLVQALVDIEPDPPPDPPAPPFVPRPAPSPRRLLTDSVAAAAVRPVELTGAAIGAVRRPAEVARRLRSTATALVEFGSRATPAPWNIAVSPHRRWVRADVPLAEVRAVRDQVEATINDVVLEICTGALRAYLMAHDQDVTDRTLKAMVPVSRRRGDEHLDADGNLDTLGNKVSLIVAELPVGIDDPVERLARIHAQTGEAKASGVTEGVETMLSAAGEMTLLAAPLARVVSKAIPMNLVITNIPGPPVPLYVRGARVLRAHPYVEVIDGEGLTIAVISYDGMLSFGITSDRDVMGDLDVLTEGIEAGIGHLTAALAGSR